jgi:fluoride exporter
MNPLFPVMAGGAIGAGLRYLTGTLLFARAPYGTLAVNLIGGFAMGLLAALILKGVANEPARLFIGVGILGGFTTFSAFSLDSWQMLERGQWGAAGLYALVSVVGSILALGIGFNLAKAIT